jgi:peptide/nickel transport system substrate-binding protein
MYPAEYHAEVGAEEFGAAPIGTGPYVFTAWNRGSSVEFEANPEYWGNAPQLAGIRFQIIPEEAARVAALEANEVHIITNLSDTSGERIEGNSDLVWVSREGARQFATFFDTRIESPVQDKLVRRALNFAVDKEALVQLFGGEATALQGQYLTPGALGFNPDVDPFVYDPDQAMSLLSEAGFADGFEISLAYTINRYALDKEMGETVAAYLEGIGLTVTQQPMEYGAFRDGFRGEVGALGPMYQWGLLTQPDPHWTLSPYQDGSDYQKMPDDPVAKDLIARGAESTDDAEREAIYQELVAHWNEDPIGIYLVVPNDLYATSASVTGFTPRRDQVLWLFDVGLSS